jgi:hypothetical protein
MWRLKNSWVGATSWYHCIAEDSRISKMPVINLLRALDHPQTQKRKKNYPAWIVNSQPQLLRFCLFWWIDLQIRNRDFNHPSNWWVSLFQKSEFAVVLLGFEKLGLELDNCGRTTKNAYCRIYSLWCWLPLKNAMIYCRRAASQNRTGRACDQDLGENGVFFTATSPRLQGVSAEVRGCPRARRGSVPGCRASAPRSIDHR